MKTQLIINADDFGLHPDINEGILTCIRAGGVTSLSMVTNTPLFDQSIQQLKDIDSVSVGVHLNLTDGQPLSPAEHLNFLLNGRGVFFGQHWPVVHKILSNSKKLHHIEEEFIHQVERLRTEGVRISHIDGHGHIHMLPSVFKIIAKLARRYDIPCIRVSNEPLDVFGVFDPKRMGIYSLVKEAVKIAAQQNLRSPKHFYGIREAGRFNEPNLKRTLEDMQGGLTELAVHPGSDNTTLQEAFRWNYQWEEETKALCSPHLSEYLRENSIQLTNFEQAGEYIQ